jgi:phage shock protein C
VKEMHKKLTKSPNNIVFTGTLAGISEWFGIDPTIVRVVYVLLSVFSAGFPGFFLYIALAVLIPSGKGKNYRGFSEYGHNDFYTKNSNPYARNNEKQRKQAEKIDDDDWSDF